jgi:hypothetical protein
MSSLGLSAVVQMSLMAGLAGLLWPERIMPVFAVLMYPWVPTRRTLWIHSLGAVALSLLLFLTLWVRPV